MRCLLMPSVGLGMSLISMRSPIQCRRLLSQQDKTRNGAGYDNPSILASLARDYVKNIEGLYFSLDEALGLFGLL